MFNLSPVYAALHPYAGRCGCCKQNTPHPSKQCNKQKCPTLWNKNTMYHLQRDKEQRKVSNQTWFRLLQSNKFMLTKKQPTTIKSNVFMLSKKQSTTTSWTLTQGSTGMCIYVNIIVSFTMYSETRLSGMERWWWAEVRGLNSVRTSGKIYIYDANSKQNKSMLSGANSIKLVGVKHQLNKITPQHFNQKRRVLYGGRVSSTCMPGDQWMCAG